MKFSRASLLAGAVALLLSTSAFAASVSVLSTHLSGTTGSPSFQVTGVFRFDLTNVGGLTSLDSITLTGNNTGGAPGRFTGFDLDAIVLSHTLISNASGAPGLTTLNVFDYSSVGTNLTPGTLRSSVHNDTQLFGTLAGSNNTLIDNSVARIGIFDAVSTTSTPDLTPGSLPYADGYVSIGDGGVLKFTFSSPVSITSPIYLYIGEAGNNTETVSTSVVVSGSSGGGNTVPLPTAMVSGLGLIGALGLGSKVLRRKA